jgi:hypothetical protein
VITTLYLSVKTGIVNLNTTNVYDDLTVLLAQLSDQLIKVSDANGNALVSSPSRVKTIRLVLPVLTFL